MDYLDLIRQAEAGHQEPTGTPRPTGNGTPASEAVTLEPAAPNARPVFWEQADGRILGPAIPEFLAQVGDRFWVVVHFDGAPRWIRSDRLRSKQAFDQQVNPIPFERITEVR